MEAGELQRKGKEKEGEEKEEKEGEEKEEKEGEKEEKEEKGKKKEEITNNNCLPKEVLMAIFNILKL